MPQIYKTVRMEEQIQLRCEESPDQNFLQLTEWVRVDVGWSPGSSEPTQLGQQAQMGQRNPHQLPSYAFSNLFNNFGGGQPGDC